MAKTFSAEYCSPSRERVAHVGFHAVGAPMAASTSSAHIFGVGLSGGVVVEGKGI